jgi:hypothetical protein
MCMALGAVCEGAHSVKLVRCLLLVAEQACWTAYAGNEESSYKSLCATLERSRT